MKKTFDNSKLDIIIPIMTESDQPDIKEVIDTIRFQKENYGFTRFALTCPSKGWRRDELPPLSHYEKLAKDFLEIKSELAKDGIDCGWWNTLTVKSGASEKYSRMISMDGTETPFSSCPLDLSFQKAFAEANARFAKIAKPSFIILEDDYSITASVRGDWKGCYCKHHLEAFAKRIGKLYTREELINIFKQQTPESYALYKKWRELMADSLVSLAEAVRREVDIESPEIPIGSMQAGSADHDGNSTEKVARALAGPAHTPFCRLHGTKYCDRESAKNIPDFIYSPIYSRQHIKGDFCYYHESDTFPQTRFYMPASKMRAIMSIVYSAGFDGSTFQTAQILDDCNEDMAYGLMFNKERARFNEAARISKQCNLKGVEIDYDPFRNTAIPNMPTRPYWTQCVSQFGIPFTTVESEVAFWDVHQARYADDETVMKYLSKGLFLDGDAAKALCERGYSQYIGVEMVEDVIEGRMRYDLDAREIIKPPFDQFSKGKNMPAAHMFSDGKNGKLLEMKVVDPKTEIISEQYAYTKEFISVAMTRFENKLGGRIVVMGCTLERNLSHSLFNYRRQRLFHELVKWCSDSYVFTENQPNVFTMMNEAKNPAESGFSGMLTLINLGDDPIEETILHLPPKWKDASFCIMNEKGEWVEKTFERKEDAVIIRQPLSLCNPLYILIQ